MGGWVPFGFWWPYFPNARSVHWAGQRKGFTGCVWENWAINTVTMGGQTRRPQLLLCPSSCHPMCMAPSGMAAVPAGIGAVDSQGDFANGASLGCWEGKIVPDDLYGPGVGMRVLRRRRQAGKKKRRGCDIGNREKLAEALVFLLALKMGGHSQ